MRSTLSFWLLVLSGVFYGTAFVFHFLSFSGAYEKGHRFALTLMRAGFLVSTFYLAEEAVESGFFLPVANLSQAMVFFGWCLAFVYLVLLVKIQTDSFGLIMAPILGLLALLGMLSKMWIPAVEPPKPILMHPYFTLHIASAFFAYASFTLSFSAGILYLIQHHELKTKKAGTFYHKLTSLEELERLVYQPLFWGAPLLVIAMAIGFAWSKSVFGEFWLFDPKTIATLVTVIFYAVLLYLRAASVLHGRQVALLSLVAYVLVVFSFVGTRFLEGSHNYLQ